MRTWSSSVSLPLTEIARKVDAKLEGDGGILISGVAPIETASEGDITFVANRKYLEHLATTRASAVILDEEAPSSHPAVLRHANPYLTYACVVDLLYPDAAPESIGVHASVILEPETSIDASATVGPLCHIGRGSKLGPGTHLVSSVYVGEDVTIGENCLLHPGVRVLAGSRIGDNVTIHSSTVIGSDGFGFAESATGLKKIKQIGWVEIGDDVEIGSNCSVDRGALGPTRIGQGTKIDNLVQVAHNVEIGKHCIIVSQVGISGSTKLGNGVILAGQVGLIGHLTIGDGVRVAAQSGVAKSVDPGRTVMGSPARDVMQSKKIEAALARLPDLLKRVGKLEKKLPE